MPGKALQYHFIRKHVKLSLHNCSLKQQGDVYAMQSAPSLQVNEEGKQNINLPNEIIRLKNRVPLAGMPSLIDWVLRALCYHNPQISLLRLPAEQRGAENPHDRHGLEAHGLNPLKQSNYRETPRPSTQHY